VVKLYTQVEFRAQRGFAAIFGNAGYVDLSSNRSGAGRERSPTTAARARECLGRAMLRRREPARKISALARRDRHRPRDRRRDTGATGDLFGAGAPVRRAAARPRAAPACSALGPLRSGGVP
jgi:hypothetical protein